MDYLDFWINILKMGIFRFWFHKLTLLEGIFDSCDVRGFWIILKIGEL